jgi:hypothetical protein
VTDAEQMKAAGIGDVTLRQTQALLERVTKERDVARDEARTLERQLAAITEQACGESCASEISELREKLAAAEVRVRWLDGRWEASQLRVRELVAHAETAEVRLAEVERERDDMAERLSASEAVVDKLALRSRLALEKLAEVERLNRAHVSRIEQGDALYDASQERVRVLKAALRDIDTWAVNGLAHMPNERLATLRGHIDAALAGAEPAKPAAPEPAPQDAAPRDADMEAVLAMTVDACKAELRRGGVDSEAVAARGAALLAKLRTDAAPSAPTPGAVLPPCPKCAADEATAAAVEDMIANPQPPTEKLRQLMASPAPRCEHDAAADAAGETYIRDMYGCPTCGATEPPASDVRRAVECEIAASMDECLRFIDSIPGKIWLKALHGYEMALREWAERIRSGAYRKSPESAEGGEQPRSDYRGPSDNGSTAPAPAAEGVARALELLRALAKVHDRGPDWVDLREAITALTAPPPLPPLPPLPPGWTAERIDALECWTYAGQGFRFVNVYDNGGVYHWAPLPATELHAVLAHHLAREAGR